MKRTQLSTRTLLLISVLFMGCGSAVYLTVTRPAEVNLKDFDKLQLEKSQAGGATPSPLG